MLGEIITRGLVLVLGYAYPAFECLKTLERNRVGIEELRFWCQYWIIIALLTVLERIGDVLVSWLPMYGELKLALVIYLWSPKTKGTGYVYQALRPYFIGHETEIERKVEEFRARAWDFALYYWDNCTELGQTAAFKTLQYMASRSANFSLSHPKGKPSGNEPLPPMPEASHTSPWFKGWRSRRSKTLMQAAM